MNGHVIVVGRNNQPQDDDVLVDVAVWLENEGRRPDLANRLLGRDFDDFDMMTLPDRGDALDAIESLAHAGEKVELIIALHLAGIGRIPGGRGDWHEGDAPYFYSRRNYEIHKLAKDVGAILVCYGDQPWFGVTAKPKQIRNRLFVYEP